MTRSLRPAAAPLGAKERSTPSRPNRHADRTGETGEAPELLRLQRSAGNAAVASMLTAEPAALPDLEAPVEAAPGGPEPDADVLAESATAREAVDAEANSAVERVAQSAAARRDQLTSVYSAQSAAGAAGTAEFDAGTAAAVSVEHAAVAGVAASAANAIDAAAAGARRDTAAQVTDMSGEARTHAETQASNATGESAARASEVTPPATSADPEVAGGQQRIAAQAQGRAREELGRAGAGTAGLMRERAEERQRSLYGPARDQADQQIQATSGQADTAIRQGRGVAASALHRTAVKSRAMARRAGAAATRGFDTGHRTAISDLETAEREATGRIRGFANQLGERLQAQGRQLAAAVASRRASGSERAEALAAVRTAGEEAVAGVRESADGLDGGVITLAQAHEQSASGVADQVAGAFEQAATGVRAALSMQSDAYRQTALESQTAVVDDLGQAPARTQQAVAPHHASGIAELSTAEQRSRQAQAEWVGTANARVATGTDQYAGEAQRLASNAREAPVQRLFEFIGTMRTWLRENLGDVLGGIVSGLILSLPAILIAVGLLFAGPVGWGILAALLVVGVGLGIYGRFSEYSDDHGGEGPSFWEGVGLVGLGIADITGIPYIVEAIAGRRAFAPQPMSTFERWERGTQGVVNLAILVAGGAKKLFGRSGTGEPPVPGRGGARVEPVPGERGPTEPVPGEGRPTEPAPAGQRPTVSRARMTELVREAESGRPIEMTPELAEALRMNAELATAKWLNLFQGEGRTPWASIRNQMNLTRWRFLPQAPEAAAVLRNALMRLPAGPERAEMLALLNRWVGGGGTPVPVPIRVPDGEEAE